MEWAGQLARMEKMRGAYTVYDRETWNKRII